MSEPTAMKRKTEQSRRVAQSLRTLKGNVPAAAQQVLAVYDAKA